MDIRGSLMKDTRKLVMLLRLFCTPKICKFSKKNGAEEEASLVILLQETQDSKEKICYR